MCGIAGLVGATGETVEAAEIHRMCQSIVHRGPDDEGIYARGAIGLGMRRLSIIDLAGGHQPIPNEDRTVWVVFNGEIYNFPELRRELESRGHQFYTHSDTEVIVHLYEEMGANCVNQLRGMFAIALYDERKQSLLLARDRLGKKPLHYALHRGRLLFGSEIKTILAVAPELAEVDSEGLLQYFYFGYIPDPLSAFQRIHKLPPGHLMEYANGKVTIREFWDVPAYGTHPAMSEEECLEELERRLEEAVRIRLISDVPLGALLSGGVDSSIIVALMARVSSSPVKTFSIGFQAEKFNEAEYARLVAQRFGTDHHELVLDPNLEETLSFLSGMLEEPFGDSSMLPTYFVCRMARQQVTVALSGDGGDELFAGYDRYLVAMERQKFDLMPRWLGRLYREQVHDRVPSVMYGKNLAWNASLSVRDRYLDDVSFFPALHRERSLFTEEFLSAARQLPDPLQRWQRYYDHAPATDQLSRLMYLDMKTYLTADILAKVDRMSMATSLEVRVPMLDQEFVEWVVALPVEWKFRAGTRKYVLKKLAERLGIPSELLHRKKQGFQMPLVEWMRSEMKDQFLRVLLEPRTLQRGYFKPEAVRALVNEHAQGRRNRSGLLWRMLVLELWHRNFLEARSNWTGTHDVAAAPPIESGSKESRDVSSSVTGTPEERERDMQNTGATMVSGGKTGASGRGKAPVFVLGCGRSGTTLLYHMLLSSGNFAVYRTESNIMNLLEPRFGDLSVPRHQRRLLNAWYASRLYTLSGLQKPALEARVFAECKNGGDFLRIIMEEMARQQGVERWADTTPEHLLHLHRIKETIPNALVIHIIRDGRDVALSTDKLGYIHRVPWDRKPSIMVCGLYWEWLVNKGRRDGRDLGGDYTEVHFEELVSRPHETLARLGEFIEHDLDYDRIQQVGIGSVSAPNSSFHDGAEFKPAGRWKSGYSAENLAMMEGLIARTLEELGYELATRDSGASNRADLQRMRAMYRKYFDSKLFLKAKTPLGQLMVTRDLSWI